MEIDSAETLARELMERHGLEDWNLEFDRARLRFGLCSHRRKAISLSRPLVLLNEEAHVRDTILHEIAHAKAGPRAAHGPEWRSVASALGCQPKARYERQHIAAPPMPWIGVCPNCGRQAHRHRRPKRKVACGACCRQYSNNRFDVRFIFAWKRNPNLAIISP